MASSDDFYARIRAKLLGAQEGYAAKVAEAAEASNARRRTKVAAKARRCRAKWSPERKKDASTRKMERAKELHGDDVFVEMGRKYRQSLKGIRYIKAYNNSAKARESSLAYIERQKALDPEGWALKNRIRARDMHHKKKTRALFMLLVNIPELPELPKYIPTKNQKPKGAEHGNKETRSGKARRKETRQGTQAQEGHQRHRPRR